MVTVTGNLWDVGRNASRASEVRVHADAYRTTGGGLITLEDVRVDVSSSGAVSFKVEPGAAVLHLVGAGRNFVGEIPILVPERNATLAECIEAARDARGQTRDGLEKFVFEVRDALSKAEGAVKAAEDSAKAADSAAMAAGQARDTATTAATNAGNSARAAGDSATVAGKSATDAAASAKTATQAKNDAASARDAAVQAKNTTVPAAEDAKKHRDDAKRFRDEAEGFKTDAGRSAEAAGSSATRAGDAKTAAEKAAGEAATSAANAGDHASTAAEHEVAAQGYAGDAKRHAERVEGIAESTVWVGDQVTVNGKTSPPLTGPKGADGTVAFDGLTDGQKASLRGDSGPPGVVISTTKPSNGEVWLDPTGGATTWLETELDQIKQRLTNGGL